MTRLRRLTCLAATAALTLGVALATAPAASATDIGGDGNPYTDCGTGQTVASAPIHHGGRRIGVVEMRWSWQCSGNWTRTTSEIGARNLLSSIDTYPYDGRDTISDDHATSHWTRYRRVAPDREMCSIGMIHEQGDWRGVRVCSN